MKTENNNGDNTSLIALNSLSFPMNSDLAEKDLEMKKMIQKKKKA
jgi:hypothetical protein